MSVATAAPPQAPDVSASAPAPQARPTSPPDHRPWHMPLAVYEKITESGILNRDDGVRHVYLWEGTLCDRMTIYRPHGLGVKNIYDAMKALGIVGYDAETELPMAFRKADSAPQPDVKVIRGRSKDYNPRMPTTADVPLVVEVAESSLSKDRALASNYAIEEIPVYWLMNLTTNHLEVYSAPVDGVYTSIQILGPGDEVPVVLDGREVGRIPVADLLP
ncbi:MAG: hypothetical protein JWN86_3917 [Planctomycetota bacterium]|nr:hypothetical protein [Planctomycetota bacterium]